MRSDLLVVVYAKSSNSSSSRSIGWARPRWSGARTRGRTAGRVRTAVGRRVGRDIETASSSVRVAAVSAAGWVVSSWSGSAASGWATTQRLVIV